MHRADYLQLVRHLVSDLPHRTEDSTHRLAPILTAVAGQQQYFLAPVHRRVDILRQIAACLHRLQQRINDGVAGYKDVLCGHLSTQQIIARCLGRCEVVIRQLTGQTAVHLLGIGCEFIPRPQPCLDVSQRHFLIKSRQSTGKRGGGIAVDQHHIGPLRRNYRLQAAQRPGSNIGESLAVLHHIQVVIGTDAKALHHLIQHFTMLGGNGHPGIKAFIGLQHPHQRCHLDSLGACAENQQDFLFIRHFNFRHLLHPLFGRQHAAPPYLPAPYRPLSPENTPARRGIRHQRSPF